jgi:hypothetical protein
LDAAPTYAPLQPTQEATYHAVEHQIHDHDAKHECCSEQHRPQRNAVLIEPGEVHSGPKLSAFSKGCSLESAPYFAALVHQPIEDKTERQCCLPGDRHLGHRHRKSAARLRS